MSNDPTFYALTERYPDEASAVRYFEEKRWPNGVTCAVCGSPDVLRGVNKKRNRQLFYCHNPACMAQFSVTSGTVMEYTKLPLRKWLLAFHLMGASKKGISSLQLSRMLGITYRAAWHLTHRIRATMTDNSQKFSGIVETDETYIGGRRKGRGRGYRGNKIAVQTIIKRGKNPKCHDDCKPGDKSQAQTIALNNGQKVDGRTVGAKLRTHTDPERTILMTDDSPIYDRVGESFAEHHAVNHSAEEYARMDPDGHLVTTNTAEGYFANLKRQLIGTHHHTSKKHLPRYLEEHDFGYNKRGLTDTERTETAIGNIEGRHLNLYKPADGRGESLYNHKVDEPAPIYIPPEGTPPPSAPVEPRPARQPRKTKATTPEAAACPACGSEPCACPAEVCAHTGTEGRGEHAR